MSLAPKIESGTGNWKLFGVWYQELSLAQELDIVEMGAGADFAIDALAYFGIGTPGKMAINALAD